MMIVERMRTNGITTMTVGIADIASNLGVRPIYALDAMATLARHGVATAEGDLWRIDISTRKR